MSPKVGEIEMTEEVAKEVGEGVMTDTVVVMEETEEDIEEDITTAIEEAMVTIMTEAVMVIEEDMTIVIKEEDIMTNKGEATIITMIIGGIEVEITIGEVTDNMTMVVTEVVVATEVEEVTEVEINQGAMQILV